MPIMDLIIQAEKVCKLHAEKDDNTTFDRLKDEKADRVAEINRLGNEVVQTVLKKNVVEVLSHVINLKEDKIKITEILIAALQVKMNEAFNKKIKGYLYSSSASQYSELVKQEYNDFIKKVEYEIHAMFNRIDSNIMQLVQRDLETPAKATMLAHKAETPAPLQVTAKKVEISDEALDQFISEVLEAAQDEVFLEEEYAHRKEQQERLAKAMRQTEVLKAAAEKERQEKALILQKFSELEKRHQALQLDFKKEMLEQMRKLEELQQKTAAENKEKTKKLEELQQQVDQNNARPKPKNEIVTQLEEVEVISREQIFKELADCYMMDLRFDKMYQDLKEVLNSSKMHANLEISKLLAMIDQYYFPVSQLYRDQLFNSPPKPPQENTMPYHELRAAIIKVRSTALSYGSFESSAQIGLFSADRFQKAQGMLSNNASSVSGHRSKLESERKAIINEFFDTILARCRPDEVERISRLNKKFGEFSHRNAEAIRLYSIQKLGFDHLLNEVRGSLKITAS